MRRQDLVEGVDYAVGSPGRYDDWQLVRVTVLKIGAAGIVIRYPDGASNYRHHAAPGETRTLRDARDFRETWESYSARLAERQEEKREHQALIWERSERYEQARMRLVRAGLSLKDSDFGASASYARFTASLEVLEKIAALVGEPSS